MREIRIAKVTLNFGAGKDQALLNKGVELLKLITGIPPIKTVTQKRLAAWGLRPGLPIGCKITLRGPPAHEMLTRLVQARENILDTPCFDDFGNVSFGIKEYIDIPGVKYDPKLGILGLQVSVTLERPGFRIKRRKIKKTRISRKHQITRENAIDYFKKHYKITVGDAE
ncbi:MAG: 50S ribosomal protein L5 [Candidatus Woesearchaeota archaeon]